MAATATELQPLDLAEPLDGDTYFLNPTCVKANIHFPVDWVLLRDAVRAQWASGFGELEGGPPGGACCD